MLFLFNLDQHFTVWRESKENADLFELLGYNLKVHLHELFCPGFLPRSNLYRRKIRLYNFFNFILNLPIYSIFLIIRRWLSVHRVSFPVNCMHSILHVNWVNEEWQNLVNTGAICIDSDDEYSPLQADLVSLSTELIDGESHSLSLWGKRLSQPPLISLKGQHLENDSWNVQMGPLSIRKCLNFYLAWSKKLTTRLRSQRRVTNNLIILANLILWRNKI